MNFESFIYNFLIVFFAMLAFYLFKSFWPKYFEAKGTNQATKEDIGEITEIIENIKSDLLQQNELIKAQLSLTNQHKLDLKSAEREAIFEFNRRVSGWIYALIRFTFSNYSQDNYKELKLTSIEFSKRQYECDLAEAHLALFIDTEEFYELKRDLIVSIIELEGIVSKAIYKVYYCYSRFEIELELEKSDARKQADIRASFYKEEKLIIDAYRKDSIEKYKKVHEFHTQMTRLIKTRLRQLEDFENNLEAE